MLNDGDNPGAALAGVRDPFLPPQPASSPSRRARDVIRGSAATSTAAMSSNAVTAPHPAEEDQQGATAESRAGIGSLVVVSMGTTAVSHVTIEAQRRIEQSDKVIYLGADPLTEHWLRSLNARVEAPDGPDERNAPPPQRADRIVERALGYVRAGLSVCIADQGASAIGGHASHEAIKRSRAEGYRAVVAPGVSMEDCLFADLGLDPRQGYQMYNAADFLTRRRRPDTSSGLILRFVGGLGERGPVAADTEPAFGLAPLVEALAPLYGPEHEVILYEPAVYAAIDPSIRHCGIGELAAAKATVMSSLYVPPKGAPATDQDMPPGSGTADGH